MAHIGVVTTLAGLFASLGFEKKAQTSVREGKPGHALDLTLLYAGLSSDFDDRNNKVRLTVSGPEATFVARPGLYLITDKDGNPQPFLWPHVERRGFYDTYISLGQPTFDATAPNKIPTGATRMIEGENVLVTYEGFERKGEPGMLGTKFFANLTIKSMEGTKKVKPGIEMTGEGMRPLDVPIGSDMMASLLGVDPADGSANLQFKYTTPLYPVEIFYQPGTIFVWVGAGIMTLGGLLAAFSRARAAKPAAGDPA